MKKILLFLFLPFLLVACSSDEPANESENVDSSSSNSEVFDNITITYEPYNNQMNIERYADIIVHIEEEEPIFKDPQWITVELKDGSSLTAPFRKGFLNTPANGLDNIKLPYWGAQSFKSGFNTTSFKDVTKITFFYRKVDVTDMKEHFEHLLLYGDGKKCNKVLRSLFK